MSNGAAGSGAEPLDLARYVWTYPVTVGDLHPATVHTAAELDARVREQTAFLNRCLTVGRIIAKTQSAVVLNVGQNGEHQLLTGAVTFIVGFTRKPYWLEDEEAPETSSTRASARVPAAVGSDAR